MSKKYKVLKICKEVGSSSKAVGLGMTQQEANEFAEFDAEVVEVADANKNDVIAALKDADLILYGGVPITPWMLDAAPKCLAILVQRLATIPSISRPLRITIYW